MAFVARPAAFFDLDRTLVACNSGHVLVRALLRRRLVSLGFAARAATWFVRYRLGRFDLDTVAERVVGRLRGHRAEDFQAFCLELCEAVLYPQITDAGRAAVAAHHAQGHFVAILSSSPEPIVAPVAKHLGIETIACTVLAVENGCFTGALATPVCWGQHKLRRAQALCRLHELDLGATTFYSDSATDLPLLEQVGRPVAINPDPRLWRTARTRGWTIERWHARTAGRSTGSPHAVR